METTDAWILTDQLNVQGGRTDPFSAAVRGSCLAMVITDPRQDDNPIIFANDAFLVLTGYERHEVTGRNCRFLQGPDTDPVALAALGEAVRKSRDITIDILNYKKDGTPFWNALHLGPVPDGNGVPRYFFGSQSDITERKRHEFDLIDQAQVLESQVKLRTRELEDMVSRGTMLLHEVDHRVKNNLQMISAMLMLQAMSIPDAKIKNTLREMLERVDAMGLVHKRLYQSDSISDFDLAAFTEEIAGTLVAATGRDDIGLEVEAQAVTIKADHAASIALIINETITNALKHAFPIGRGGDLRVSVKPAKGACEISIRDDGPGMPTGATTKSGFGRTLIETLVQQLRATIEWLPASPGTHVRIMLPMA